MIDIKPIKEWTEKDNSNGIRIYCGHVHLGTAYPDRRRRLLGNGELFRFVSHFDCVKVPAEFVSIDEVKMHVELSLKEFVKGIVK